MTADIIPMPKKKTGKKKTGNGGGVSKTPTPEKRPVGRPPILILDDHLRHQIKTMANQQSTLCEAAAVLGVSVQALHQFMGKYPEARELWDNGQLAGRQSLRRWQANSAKKGNPAMQIWLGKQWLGQKDKQEIAQDVTIKESDPKTSMREKIKAISERRKQVGNAQPNDDGNGTEPSGNPSRLH
jgi:hypothetical protein